MRSGTARQMMTRRRAVTASAATHYMRKISASARRAASLYYRRAQSLHSCCSKELMQLKAVYAGLPHARHYLRLDKPRHFRRAIEIYQRHRLTGHAI